MARYIVQESKSKLYVRNDKMPLINLIPAIVWSVPVYQKVSPHVSTWITFGICAIFLIAYVFLSYKPLIAVVPCVGAVIMFTAIVWAPMDYIGNDVVRIIVKVLVLIICILMEFAVWVNATLPWLQRKFPEKPNIRVIND